MLIRHIVLSATALLGLATFAGACGDHRAEEFCANVCDCNPGASEQELAECTNECATSINQVEEQTGERILTDECFSCVNNSTCERFQTGCSAACETLIDALEQQQQPEPDPRPGDQ